MKCLTANQLILLRELQAVAPGIARKEHLMKCLWARKAWPEKPDRILACQISRMRPVIWPLGLAIITEYGQGYRLVGRAQPVSINTSSTNSERNGAISKSPDGCIA